MELILEKLLECVLAAGFFAVGYHTGRKKAQNSVPNTQEREFQQDLDAIYKKITSEMQNTHKKDNDF